MYTVTIENKTIQHTTNQYVLTVDFSKESSSFRKKFIFGMDVSFDEAKRVIKRFVETLEEAEVKVEGIQTGNLDLSTVAEPTLSDEDVTRNEWFALYDRFNQLEFLASKGILAGAKATALETKILELKTSLSSGFKASYLNDI